MHEIRATRLIFRPYELDLAAGRLFRGETPVPLRAKTWAMLKHLAEHPGLLVTKDQLVTAVWGHLDVSDDALTRTLGELRHALGDNARRPTIVQTVPRRGVRFIAPIEQGEGDATPLSPSLDRGAPRIFVGRGQELAQLRQAFANASAGQRQVVFVTGEPGAGKTSLVHEFLEGLPPDTGLRVAWGSCAEHFSAREPYAPILLALEHLARGDDGPALGAALRAVAPAWLAQMPALQTPEESDRVAHEASDASRSMVREFASLSDTLAARAPLVVVLDDLHWSDLGTIDLLALLARRREPARLLVIATYRPAEAAVRDHAVAELAAALESARACVRIPLGGLSRNEVADYLRHRLGQAAVDEEAAALVHCHTDGLPLFVTALAEHLLAREQLIEQDGRWSLAAPVDAIENAVPDDLRLTLEGQLRLTTASERALLDVASVAGATFDSQVVAAALGMSIEQVELLCDRMSRSGRFLRLVGGRVWPDGSIGGRYAFTHAAYQRVLRDLVSPGRRAALHRKIAGRMEAGFAGRLEDVATDLANHFQAGQDRRRAVRYLRLSAEKAYRRDAYRDAATVVESALRLIDELREPGLAREELALRKLYSVLLAQVLGYSAPALHDNLAQTLLLAEECHDRRAGFEATYGQVILHASKGNCAAAAKIAQRLLAQAVARRLPRTAVPRAEYVAGAVALWRGDLGGAGRLLKKVIAAPLHRHAVGVPTFGVDPTVGASAHESLRLVVTGHLDEARAFQRRAIQRAGEVGHPFTLAHALSFGAFVDVLSGCWNDAAETASRALAVSEKHGFPRWTNIALICHGRALVATDDVDRGLREIEDGFRQLVATGLRLGESLLRSIQADAYLRLENAGCGLDSVEQGLVYCRTTTERLFEASLWRLKGELLLLRADREILRSRRAARVDDARACFERSLVMARTQGATAFERCARLSRMRLSCVFERRAGVVA